jgi:DNA recombination protein RmuC
MEQILLIIAGLAAGALLGWLASMLRQSATIATLMERARQGESAAAESTALRQENEQLKLRVNSLEKEREADAEKLAWAQTAEQSLREAFQSLAAQTLQTNAQEFLKRARDQLDALANQLKGDWGAQKLEIKNLVEPLQKSLAELDQQVQTLERRREGAYEGLTKQIEQLFQTNRDLQHTAATLAQALKSPTVRGRWGEVQLRRVVEMAGLTRHVDFDEQHSTDAGRPDMVVRLPNGGVLPVDAKTPMESFLASIECPEGERAGKLAEHANAVRSRITELGKKQYWSQFEKTPDFVVMFVPNDSCLSVAYEQDPTLLEYALQQRVLPTTPVTLLALLKAVAYGWQQQQVSENARRIAQLGREIYERIGTFNTHLSDLGRNLTRSVESYNRTVGSLESRLLPSARKLGELGVSADALAEPAPVDLQTRIPLPPEAGTLPEVDIAEAPEEPATPAEDE